VQADALTGRGAAQAPLVLLVEDDEDLREVIGELLEEEGYEVLRAANGADALELLSSCAEPSLVLTDLMMPVMTGWELVARLRAHPQHASLPIIVVSAFFDRAPPESDHVLMKPLQLDQLLQSVEEMIRRRTHAAAPP
jgi:CheY-like chemotaxis protein